MKPTLKSIKLFVSAVLWVTLAACGGVGSSGARSTSTDPTGKVTVWTKVEAYGDITITFDGIELDKKVYFSPDFALKCGDFNTPGKPARELSEGIHNYTATASTGASLVSTVTISSTTCLSVELL